MATGLHILIPNMKTDTKYAVCVLRCVFVSSGAAGPTAEQHADCSILFSQQAMRKPGPTFMALRPVHIAFLLMFI